jgi:hypothetical protein
MGEKPIHRPVEAARAAKCITARHGAEMGGILRYADNDVADQVRSR